MVKEIKAVSKTTKKAIENAYEVIAMAAGIAAACKVAVEPKVLTGFGSLPVWQIVAAILLAGVAYRVFTLQQRSS